MSSSFSRFQAGRWPILGWLLLAIVVLACRLPLFGDPLIHSDETFYNLVGERMLHGAVPFVDIWDRKPVGLFLIYAASHALLGSGVLGYQLIAALSVFLTAVAIERLASRIADRQGSRLAAVTYILGLAVFRCSGGQSPVFYNLPMVLAAGMMLALATQKRPDHLVIRGAAAMLLVGLALQIKYTVVFEGIAFGIVLLWLNWRKNCSVVKLIAAGLVWVASALAPTALALGWYALHGYAQEFIWANFLSIFLRDTGAALSLDRISDLATDIALTLPFWAGGLYWFRHRHTPAFATKNNTIQTLPGAQVWLLGWAGVATFGFLIFGTYYDHYTAALLPSFAVLLSPILGCRPGKRMVTAFILSFLIIAGSAITIGTYRKYGGRTDLDRAAALISPNLHGRCLYVFEGYAALYSATHACTASRFVFPSHISRRVDSVALGVDSRVALQRILDHQPGVIVVNAKPDMSEANLTVRPMLHAALAHNYELYARTNLGKLNLLLYRLREYGR
ncbi:ArnT family glycosyltransferase [Novosphingobium sp. 9]|uniref:ArnT family glycosyltransferase n=1 Tax=Novosphingobium sp. 9 TaxID=2025349 RepID=UPI0021B5E89B|nr:glycosyltransferase family 39 protein [Novosphingobium sp. 9]